MVSCVSEMGVVLSYDSLKLDSSGKSAAACILNRLCYIELIIDYEFLSVLLTSNITRCGHHNPLLETPWDYVNGML